MKQNPRIRVLVVEDHLVTLDGLCSALRQQEDMDVIGTATNYRNGLELAQKYDPDCILLDLHLPDSPGPKTMIRQFCSSTAARLVVFSGEDREIFIEGALLAGADAYVLKSKPVSTVCDLIRKVVAEDGQIKDPSRRRSRLSDGEKDILRLLAQGLKYQDMADRRGSSASTVRKQCDRLQLKLDLANREELIAWAAENGYGVIDE